MKYYLKFNGQGSVEPINVSLPPTWTVRWVGYVDEVRERNPLFTFYAPTTMDYLCLGFRDSGVAKIFSPSKTLGEGNRRIEVGNIYDFKLHWDGTQLHLYINNELDYSVVPEDDFISTLEQFQIGWVLSSYYNVDDLKLNGGMYHCEIEGVVVFDPNHRDSSGSKIYDPLKNKFYSLEGTWPEDNSHYVLVDHYDSTPDFMSNTVLSTVSSTVGDDELGNQIRAYIDFDRVVKNYIALNKDVPVTQNFEIELLFSTNVFERGAIFSGYKQREKGVYADVDSGKVRFFSYTDTGNLNEVVASKTLVDDFKLRKLNFVVKNGSEASLYVNNKREGFKSYWNVKGNESLRLINYRNVDSSANSGIIANFRLWTNGDKHTGEITLDMPLDGRYEEDDSFVPTGNSEYWGLTRRFSKNYTMNYKKLPDGNLEREDGHIVRVVYE